jgi:hypothetical protein
MRHREMHFINLPAPVRLVYDLARSLFSEKMRKRFKVRNCSTTLIQEFKSDLHEVFNCLIRKHTSGERNKFLLIISIELPLRILYQRRDFKPKLSSI